MMQTDHIYRDIELDQLDLDHSHTRIKTPSELTKLMVSIERHGQLHPAVVIPTPDTQRWLLIDGYRRRDALEKLNRDIIKVQIWSCDAGEALLTLLMQQQAHCFDALEQSMLFRELISRYQLSQSHIARRLGCSQSVISRRLELIDQAPEMIATAIRRGTLTPWTANRVLIPMARAIEAHAQVFLNYLNNHSHSTREIKTFFDHYQRSNKITRDNMINNPSLFFKSQQTIQQDQSANDLRRGPEGRWLNALSCISRTLSPLKELMSGLFNPCESKELHSRLLPAFHKTKHQFDSLANAIKEQLNVKQQHASTHQDTVSERQK